MSEKKDSLTSLKAKLIFVVGGVMSGVGKGITAASIGRILSAKGFRVSAIKIDPYINIDAGTMNPIEHGEVFVTEDGDETDQDIGNYERFLGVNIYKANYMTTGRVYQSVINKERNLEYGGRCVQVVPHIPEEIINRINLAVEKTGAEIMVIEIGGTVGEYENLLFLEAARYLHLENPDDVLFVMVSYLPIPSKVGEMKTKPTQHAVRSLNSAGIQPDFIVARASVDIDEPRRRKIAIHCNVKSGDVISAPDIESIYEVPLNFERDRLGDRILEKFKLEPRATDLSGWQTMYDKVKNADKIVRIGIVGKYFETGDFTLTDSYISVIEAIKHGAAVNDCKAELAWLSAEEVEKNGVEMLKSYDGIIIPQGWGSRGSEGKIKAIEYCRVNKVPYFGLCYGMQMAVIEYARNVLGLSDANSEEANPETANPVIHIMPEQKELILKKGYGGTIRLGGWPCQLVDGSKLSEIYASKFGDNKVVSERHRHRYEFNNEYRKRLEDAGLKVSGVSPDNLIVEAVEITDHPFFIGTQFHPEYISRPLDPHPLFVAFVKACLK